MTRWLRCWRRTTAGGARRGSAECARGDGAAGPHVRHKARGRTFHGDASHVDDFVGVRDADDDTARDGRVAPPRLHESAHPPRVFLYPRRI